MKPLFILSVLLPCLAVLFGCAAVGVPSSDDPERKLGWAMELVENQDRPLPAERLIREAIDICTSQGNDFCLGRAYSKYGYFFKSDSVARWEDVYRKNGFLDKAATFDQRIDKSTEYYLKARELFIKINSYDQLSNVDYFLADNYEETGNHKMACNALDSSLEYNNKFKQSNPDKLIRTNGFKSFDEVIANKKLRYLCP